MPSLVMTGVLFGMAKVVEKARRTQQAWNGFTAEARCLRTFTTTRGGHDAPVTTTRHHVFEFTTYEGRTVRFAEEGAPLTILEGDITTVHYVPGRPEKATAQPPDRRRLVARTGFALLLLGPFAVGCLVMMVRIGPTVGD
ncbi:hypothetical protein [Streptomyces phaeoluteigriseus]